MLTVSNYHYIRPNFNTKYPSIFGVTPDEFEKQLLTLKNHGDFISPIDLVSNLEMVLKSNVNYFFVTFDDGLREQHKYALPVLNNHKIPAVFFANSRNFQDEKVSTVHKIHLLRSILSPLDFIKEINKLGFFLQIDIDQEKAKKIYIYDDAQSAVLKYILNFKINFVEQERMIKVIFDSFFDENEILNELYMSKDEVVELSNKGYLGSHTHNHFPVGMLDKKEMKYELENSKLYFEKLTNSTIELLAYPYGTPEASTIEAANIATEVGYKIGFTTTRGVNTNQQNNLLLHRFDCNDLPGGKNYIKI
ncbi:polysaccharide deacetylase family protein [Flavobacterium sp.]|uniref:polysaccharide deacetylase family protein n=1 Tax=Flavobacterium sp. TaxID=239 RepID=UPI003751F0F7